MVGSQRPLPDLQGAFEEGAGGGQFTIGPEQQRQVVESGGGEGVVGPEHSLPDGEGALQEGPGGIQLALRFSKPWSPARPSIRAAW